MKSFWSRTPLAPILKLQLIRPTWLKRYIRFSNRLQTGLQVNKSSINHVTHYGKSLRYLTSRACFVCFVTWFKTGQLLCLAAIIKTFDMLSENTIYLSKSVLFPLKIINVVVPCNPFVISLHWALLPQNVNLQPRWNVFPQNISFPLFHVHWEVSRSCFFYRYSKHWMRFLFVRPYTTPVYFTLRAVLLLRDTQRLRQNVPLTTEVLSEIIEISALFALWCFGFFSSIVFIFNKTLIVTCWTGFVLNCSQFWIFSLLPPQTLRK